MVDAPVRDEKGFLTYSPEQYSSHYYDYGDKMSRIDWGATGAKADVAAPDASLAAQSGINVQTDKPSVEILKIHDEDTTNLIGGDKEQPFNIFSGTTFKGEGMEKNYNKFNKKNNTTDKSTGTALEEFMMLGTAGIFGKIMGGDLGVGTQLQGPMGDEYTSFSGGKISEMAMKNHYENFTESKAAYVKLGTKDVNDKEFTHFNTDTGFASNLKLSGFKHHFSRKPGATSFEGNLTALHPDTHTAHMMLKSMEALAKGLDPRGSGPFKGYRLDNKNEDNRGMSEAMLSNGMGGISNDGYYTYVSGGPLGHTKVRLHKGGHIAKGLAKELATQGYNISGATLVELMAEARKGDTSFTKLLEAHKTTSSTEKILAGAGQHPDADKWWVAPTPRYENSIETGKIKISELIKGVQKFVDPKTQKMGTMIDDKGNVVRSSKELIDVEQQVITEQQALAQKQLEAAQKEKGIREDSAIDAVRGMFERQARREQQQELDKSTAGKIKDMRTSGRITGFKQGGQVSSPVGQLASMLRSNRLGYNQGGAVQSGFYGYQEGGQINMQDMGFVNGKTPDQVTDAQSVADTEAMSADEGDFVINAPAVEAVGVEAVVGLVSDALNLAAEEEVEIIDIPQDTSPEVMVDILVSEGEFIVPRELIPFVDGGIETLEKINALGAGEVSQRVDETAMMEQMGDLEAPPQEALPQEALPQEVPPQQDSYIEEEQLPAFQKGGTVLPYDLGYLR